MRLRRETGDFQIRMTISQNDGMTVESPLPKGLLMEDFVGQMVEMTMVGFLEDPTATTHGWGVISGVGEAGGSDDSLLYSLSVSGGNFSIYYNPETGVLSTTND